MTERFEIIDRGAALGAEVRGLDLSSPIWSLAVDQLYQAWLKYKVLYFRNQMLTAGQQVEFTSQFGELDQYPFLQGITGYPLVAPVLKLPDQQLNFGGVWHSDTTYLDAPAKGATLYALEIPPAGGDTLFADMELVYRQLPRHLKHELGGLSAINSSSKKAIAQTRGDTTTGRPGKRPARRFTSCHPVVRTHPETGRRSLYVNEAHTTRIKGWDIEDSNKLLARLFPLCRNPEVQFRLKWQPGTLVIWDNRATQHFPINDYQGYRRLLHRVSIRGSRPV